MNGPLLSPEEDFLADLAYAQPNSTIQDGLTHHALVNNRGSAGSPRANERWSMDRIEAAIQQKRAVFAVQTGVPLTQVPKRFPHSRDIRYLELLLRLREDELCAGPSSFPLELWRNDTLMPKVFHDSLRAAVAMRQFMREHEAAFPIALNVNDAVLADVDFESNILASWEADPARPLVLELHETISEAAIAASIDSLRTLARQGVKIAIDDAPRNGSLRTLAVVQKAKIPVEYLKISGAIIANIRRSSALQMQLIGLAATAQFEAIPQIIVEGHEKFRSGDLETVRELATRHPGLEWLLQSPPPGKDAA